MYGIPNSNQKIESESYSDEDLNAALGFVEEFIQVGNDLKEFVSRLKPEQQPEGTTLVAKLESLIAILDTERVPLPLVKGALLSGAQYRSVIERLGISGELIRLRQAKWSIKKIASNFNIAPQTVSRFFQYYDSMKPSEKAKYARKSVFDSTDRLEELMTMILRQIARLEGTQDDIAVKYTSELRQTLQLAVQVSEKIANYERYQTFTRLVSDVLLTEVPAERRPVVLQKIQTLNVTSGNILPSSY